MVGEAHLVGEANILTWNTLSTNAVYLLFVDHRQVGTF